MILNPNETNLAVRALDFYAEQLGGNPNTEAALDLVGVRRLRDRLNANRCPNDWHGSTPARANATCPECQITPDTRACVAPGEPEHDHSMCQDVVFDENRKYAARWHRDEPVQWVRATDPLGLGRPEVTRGTVFEVNANWVAVRFPESKDHVVFGNHPWAQGRLVAELQPVPAPETGPRPLVRYPNAPDYANQPGFAGDPNGYGDGYDAAHPED